MGAAEDPGEHRVAFALREGLPTRRHAEMLFDMAADLLGTVARIEATPDGNWRSLYRLDATDPRWVIPWPLLTLDRNPRNIFPLDIPGLKPAPPPPPRPGKAPRLRGLGPGYIQVQDGVRYVQVAYAEDGRWFETSRGGPPTTLEGVLPLLAGSGGPAAERLASFVAALDAARHGPLRVHLPKPEAWNAWAAWRKGIDHLHRAIARGTIPPEARWAAIDCVDGTALAWGATRDEALFAWSAEVGRVRPGSAPPPARPSFEPPGEPDLPPPPDEEGEGKGRGGILRIQFGISFGEADPMLPRPAPEAPPPDVVPAAVIPLPDLPPEPAPLGRWRRFLGGCGATVPAAWREDPAGWTLVGAPALATLGAPDAEAAMDEAERAREAWLRERNAREPPPTPATAWTIRLFRLLDESTGGRCPPSTEQALQLGNRDVPPLDGALLAIGAARLRRTKP